VVFPNLAGAEIKISFLFRPSCISSSSLFRDTCSNSMEGIFILVRRSIINIEKVVRDIYFWVIDGVIFTGWRKKA
jgi:hypothetical protein